MTGYPEDYPNYEYDLEAEHWASIGEAIYMQQLYEHDLEYNTRLAHSYPRDAHTQAAEAWLEQQENKC